MFVSFPHSWFLFIAKLSQSRWVSTSDQQWRISIFLCDCSSGNGGSQEAHYHILDYWVVSIACYCVHPVVFSRPTQGVGREASRDLSFIKIKSDGLHQMINPIKKLNLLGGCGTCEAPFLQAFLDPCINLWIIMKFRESLLIIHMFPHKKDCYTVRSPLRLPATNQTCSLQLRGGDVTFFTSKTKQVITGALSRFRS